MQYAIAGISGLSNGISPSERGDCASALRFPGGVNDHRLPWGGDTKRSSAEHPEPGSASIGFAIFP